MLSILDNSEEGLSFEKISVIVYENDFFVLEDKDIFIVNMW